MVDVIKNTQIEVLRATYQNATRKGGLIDFCRSVRTPKNDLSGKYSVTLNEVNKLFVGGGWVDKTGTNGHRKFEHKVTKVVIEYVAHKTSVDPGAVETLFNNIQAHLNMMSNNIFQYTSRNWKVEPDYQAALARWA